MTGPQRKAHVLLWLVLGPIALIGLVFAVQWRPAEPVQDGGLPGVESSIQSGAAEPENAP